MQTLSIGTIIKNKSSSTSSLLAFKNKDPISKSVETVMTLSSMGQTPAGKLFAIIFVLIVFVYTTTYFACYYYCRIYRVRHEQHRMPDSIELYQQRLDDLEEQRRRATEHKAIVVSRISSNPRVSSTNCTTETSFSSGNNSVEILTKEWKSCRMRLLYEAIIFPIIETSSSTSLTTRRLWSSLIFYSANEAHYHDLDFS